MISEHDRQVLSSLPVWNPAGDIVAQRAAWEELARVFNRDLPEIGDLDKDVELRAGLRADVAVPQGRRSASRGHLPARWRVGVRHPRLVPQARDAICRSRLSDHHPRLSTRAEHPFPAALEDAMFAIGWAADNARRWNGDGRRIAIGGDSAGANLALSAITSSAPQSRAAVRAALLFYGAFDLAATAERNRAHDAIEDVRRGQHGSVRRSAR